LNEKFYIYYHNHCQINEPNINCKIYVVEF